MLSNIFENSRIQITIRISLKILSLDALLTQINSTDFGQGRHRTFDFIGYIKTLNNYLRMHREQALLFSLEDVDEDVAAIW